jgi:diguanylate cyclase (GGDEF)-like protein
VIVLKNFLYAKEVLKNEYQLDIIEDLLLSKKCRVIGYLDKSELTNQTIRLIAGDFAIFGLSTSDSLPLSTLMDHFDYDNKYAEVAGKKEYQDYVLSQLSLDDPETDVTLPILVQGKKTWIRFNSYSIEKNPAIQFVSMVNLSSVMNQEEALYEKTHKDSLTGLFNRYTFDYHYGLRYHWPDFHALYLDLDDFKQINDRYSHATGNEFLCEFAEILKSYEDEYNHFYRLGGDEFVGMFFKPKESVTSMAEEIIKRTQAIHLPHLAYRVSVSIGIVKAMEADRLIQKADQVLYDVKSHGKNHYRYCIESDMNL